MFVLPTWASPECVYVLVQVRVAALQNLVKIMSLYYQYMEAYMGPALFAVRSVCVRVYVRVRLPSSHIVCVRVTRSPSRP